MPDPEWVRVRQPETGHHITLTAEQAKAADLTPLKQDAVDANGNPLPPKYHVDKGSTGKSGAESAAKKES